MRFHLIDALRGIAAMWVVLHHLYDGSHIENLAAILPDFVVNVLFRIGGAGVPIFFVISGFVIAHSLRNDKVDTSYIGKFALRRSARLDPPYWASIIFVVGLTYVSVEVKNEVMIWPSSQQIVAHIFYLQDILEFESLNLIYWTLCLEIQFYIVFCLLVSFIQKFGNEFKHARFTILVGVAFISLLWPLGILEENIYEGLFFPQWHAFLLGAFAYWSWKQRMSSSLFYIYAIIIIVGEIFTPNLFTIAAVGTTLIVYICAKLNYIKAMNWSWLQFLGKISYSIYLTHSPVTGAAFFVIYKVLGRSVVIEGLALILVIGIGVTQSY